MQNRLLSVMIFCLCLPLAVVASAASTDALAEQLAAIKTMQAHFTQQIVDEQGSELQSSSGDMALQRPGKFRWFTEQPTQQLIVANGEVLWIYDIDLEQATGQNFSASAGQTPAALLSGNYDELQAEFTIDELAEQAGQQRYRLIPKQDDQSLQWIELSFAKEQLVAMRLLDNLGQYTHLHFAKIKLNQPLPETLFTFTPPQHVDVIDQFE